MPIKTPIFLTLVYVVVVLNPGEVLAAPNPKALLLNCGSKDAGSDTYNRTWVSDLKYLASADKTVEAVAQSQDPSLLSAVPFMNARFFTGETTYNLPVNGSQRYFLRLHFYPSRYPNFNISNSYFAAVAGSVTLLNNFSASITARAALQASVTKEYSLAPCNSDFLSLVFRPSENSFAFLNGIELIPMPALFGVAASMIDKIPVDTDNLTVPMDTSGKNLQTMRRLNVGGKDISPVKDSGGLERNWDDDSKYLLGSNVGSELLRNLTTDIYSNVSESTAPVAVYETGRELRAHAAVAVRANLTWVFQVDTNFTYLARLHFCEVLTKPNQRVFNIFINEKLAFEFMDIFFLFNKASVATYKDFATFMPAGAGNELRVTLKPNDTTEAQYLDVLLNGLEIFKLADEPGATLAGPNPDLSKIDETDDTVQEPANKPFTHPKKGLTGAIIAGTAGAAAAFAFVAAAIFGLRMKKKRLTGSQSRSTTSWLPLYNSHTSDTKTSGKSHGSTNISSSAAANCRYFSLAEIQEATKNFDESNVIGVGGFGKVYKGIIDNGNTKVAIKRSNPSSDQGVNEFQTEIEMLSKLRHRHLVSLIGFCEDNHEMILVYDFMGRGTLREHLYKGNIITLSWKQRLEICIGAARGLHYLHTGAQYTIIHRDVKTTNILLDEKWVAKVSDFGLSKTGPNMNQGHVSTVVKGSFGYLDPEYFRRQQLTEKSDVYSFGVVLFEVLCARPALNPTLPKEQVSLADWAASCQRKGALEDIIDPHLKGKIKPECLKKFAETAEKCLSDHGTDRPAMGDVLWTLEWILQVEENGGDGSVKQKRSPEGNDQEEAEIIDNNCMLAMHRNTLSLGSDEDDVETEKKDESTNDIFSQIVRPTGR